MSEGKKPEGIFEGTSEHERPLFSYAVLAGPFNLLFGVATHKPSWLLARVAVTSPRVPFAELEEVESPTSVREKPRGGGLRYYVGELRTFHFCLGQWAAFFANGLLLFPAAARPVGSVFAMSTFSDFLPQVYPALLKRA